ncbi:MAG: lipopolysaccharide heptosyltransferase II [Candidatus Omnitrophota bacterium]
MNILQILPKLEVGGVETGTIDLAKYLVEHGHHCVVISAGGSLVKELEACGIRHYKLPVNHKFFGVMIKAAAKVADIIKEENIELIHARSRVPAWIGFMASHKTNVTLITTAHGYYSRHIFSAMMGWGKYTIVPSSVIGRHMVKDFGVPLENIRLISRSVDLNRFVYRTPSLEGKREPVVAVVGRVTPIKGQLYFLKAFARVLRSVSFVKAWIIGGVSSGKEHYQEELVAWVRRLGLKDAVRFLGNRRDIPELLSEVDLLVMPSVAQEAFGRVIVEAQASGVPVIATKVGGVVEIIKDGQTGLLVYPRDVESLAEAMVRILTNPSFACQLAINARKNVEENYSLEKMAKDTLKVYEEALSVKRILVIKMSALGDAVLVVPSLKAIKRKFPFSKISCLTNNTTKEVFQRCPYIDELIVCDFKGRDKGLTGLWSLAKKILGKRFDCVIDFQNNKISHLLSYLTMSQARYGYDNGKMSFLMNKAIKDDQCKPLDPVEHQFQLLKMLGIEHADEKLQLWPSEDDKTFAENFLKRNAPGAEKLIGINVGASARWQSKRWILKSYAQLCEKLAQKGYRVMLTGHKNDIGFVKKILKNLTFEPICAVGLTSLMQLACLVEKCDCFVTGDSAPMHLAAAMCVPFVALFGPTNPKRHLPCGYSSVVLQKGCVPCYKGQCPKRTNVCMKKISVEDVMEAIERLLEARKRS